MRYGSETAKFLGPHISPCFNPLIHGFFVYPLPDRQRRKRISFFDFQNQSTSCARRHSLYDDMRVGQIIYCGDRRNSAIGMGQYQRHDLVPCSVWINMKV